MRFRSVSPYRDIVDPGLVVASAQATGLPAPSDAALNAPVLKSGDSGTAVTTLQSDLSMLGPGNYTVPIDGVFGSQTLAAVTAFQTDNGLLAPGSPETTGVVGANTWQAIDDGSAMTTLPAGNAPVPGTGQWLAQVIATAPAPIVKAAQKVTPAGAPDWVLPVAVAAFSVGGLALVGGVIWWAFGGRKQ
jgi:peptidoglycan hydrolase-like protein with peptidoglycan-binding domain